MEKEILLEDICEFQKQYGENINNLNIEKKIRKLGLMKASMNKKPKLKFEFNIEVPESKIYNQLNSH